MTQDEFVKEYDVAIDSDNEKVELSFGDWMRLMYNYRERESYEFVINKKDEYHKEIMELKEDVGKLRCERDAAIYRKNSINKEYRDLAEKYNHLNQIIR